MEKKIWLNEFYFNHDIEQLYIQDDYYIIFASGGSVYKILNDREQLLLDFGPCDAKQQIIRV